MEYLESPSKLDLEFNNRHNSNSIGPMDKLDDPFGSLENPIDSIDQIDLMNKYDKTNEARANKTTTNFFKGSKQQMMNRILADNSIKNQRSKFRGIQNKSLGGVPAAEEK